MKIEIDINSKQKKKLIKSLQKKGFKFTVLESESPNILFPKKVDLGAKKTEFGWNIWLNKVVLSNVPKWFSFIEALFLLGAMGYIAETTNNIFVRIIYAFSYAFLLLFILRYFLSIKFGGFPFVKSEKLELNLSIILSFILSIASFKLIEMIIPSFFT